MPRDFDMALAVSLLPLALTLVAALLESRKQQRFVWAPLIIAAPSWFLVEYALRSGFEGRWVDPQSMPSFTASALGCVIGAGVFAAHEKGRGGPSVSVQARLLCIAAYLVGVLWMGWLSIGI